MKSLQTRILLLFGGCVAAVAILLGNIAALQSGAILRRDSQDILQLLCEQNAQYVNERLMDVEQSVDTLYQFALDALERHPGLPGNTDSLEEYTQEVSRLALTAVKNTDGALAVYFRYAPDWVDSTSGFFWVRQPDGSFAETELTDLSLYAPEDVEHVGWYYLPLQNGGATWMDPYHNQNIDVTMISHIIPVEWQGQTVGVLGMDIDVDVLYSYVQPMEVYESGAAMLLGENGALLYQDGACCPAEEASALLEQLNGQDGTVTGELDGQQQTLTAVKLLNGMQLVVSVLQSEVDRPRSELMDKLQGMTLLVLAGALVLAWVISGRMVRPLQEMSAVARRIAQGDLSAAVDYQSEDELGQLAHSMRSMTDQLRRQMNDLKQQAYVDPLTGVGSKAAYERRVAALDAGSSPCGAPYAVVVLDVNGLKQTNDTLGHEAGDALIREMAALITSVWDRDDVYRVGGDEFAVIMTSAAPTGEEARSGYERAMSRFSQECARQGSGHKIACGMAVCRAGMDYAAVFRRADERMYTDKLQKYAATSLC